MVHAEQTPADLHRRRPAAGQAAAGPATAFVNNRPGAIGQRRLIAAIDRSPQVCAQRALVRPLQKGRPTAAPRRQFAGLPAGRERAFNVPAPAALIPFDQNPLSSMGERIIFNSTYADAAPVPGAAYVLRYTANGGTFDTRDGPTVKDVQGFVSGNVNFYVSSRWYGQHAVNVTLDLWQFLPAPAAVGGGPAPAAPAPAVINTNVWNFAYRGSSPTKMAQAETEGERALGSVYTYLVSGPRAGSLYQGHTILERFQPNSCNIEYNDLRPAFRTANPGIRTNAQITEHFFGGPGNNGTFTVDAANQIYDVHGGGVPTLAAFNAAHKFPKEATSDLPQIYETSAGKIIGRYTIRRILKTSGAQVLKKFET